jgi:hypothetical protein
VQLSALATRFEGKLKWDSANMWFSNRPEATAYLKPKFRKG